MRLAGWGRYPVADCAVSTPRDERGLRAALREGPMIARGNGRAYGDSAMNRHNTVSMRRMDRMLGFDAATGQLTAEAGVLLGDIIAALLPRGWFPAVTPGTRFVTLGGAIAADVHGKNHHVDGGFGEFTDWIDVMGPDGRVRRATRDERPELFACTVGGMGLTGVILRAAIRLRAVETGWIRQSVQAVPDLAGAMAAFEAASDAPYSVAWIDCLSRGAALGRSVVMLGAHARRDELPPDQRRMPLGPPPARRLRLPIDAPRLALNRWSVGAFNAAYYRRASRRASPAFVPWESYFYPLDAILGWNRIYGRRGFVQFQCVLPEETAHDGLAALLTAISASGQGSFLSVLKKLGPAQGHFSFPMPGYTLALDFPVSKGVLRLMETLDRITIAHGGRFYLAKDARMTARTLHASDPRAAAFARMRRESGAAGAFASLQSDRLEL